MNHMPPSIAEDFEAIEAAVRETPRGRWFLEEFLRRHQSAETRNLLQAVRRLEQTLEREARLAPRIMAALSGTAAALAARIETPPPALSEVVETLADETEDIANHLVEAEGAREVASRQHALAGQLRILARGIAEIAALCGEHAPVAAAEPAVPVHAEPWFADASDCFDACVADSAPSASDRQAAESDASPRRDEGSSRPPVSVKPASPSGSTDGDTITEDDARVDAMTTTDTSPVRTDSDETADSEREGRLAIFISPARARRARISARADADDAPAVEASGENGAAANSVSRRIIIRHKSSSREVEIPFVDSEGERRSQEPSSVANLCGDDTAGGKD